MPDLEKALQHRDGSLRVAIRITPKARRDGIEGLAEKADGETEIRVSVTAVPENGKANKALIKLLAKSWNIPKSAITIASGATDRHKILSISCEPEGILPRIMQSLPKRGPRS